MSEDQNPSRVICENLKRAREWIDAGCGFGKWKTGDLQKMQQAHTWSSCISSAEARLEELEAENRSLPKTKDGKVIATGMDVWWIVCEDEAYWGSPIGTPIKSRVLSISHDLSFEQYKGTHTICTDDFECGNLELYSSENAASSENA